MTLRLLVFGTTGQVATELRRLDGPRARIRALDRAAADLGDPDRCADAVLKAEADAVINAAAWTKVDDAEAQAAAAHVVNAEAPGAMARAAARRGLPFLHLSTDYVFDGGGRAPWTEGDAPAPLSAYGRTKLAGERLVADAGGPHAILRVSWVFAGHGGNFIRTMLGAARRRRELGIVDDQRGGPTPAGAIAAALLTVAHAFARGEGVSGVFHFAGAPDVSWREFAEAIFEASARRPAPAITPITTSDWPTPAPRPLNSRLDCGRIERAYGIRRPDWRPALRAAVAELEETGA